MTPKKSLPTASAKSIASAYGQYQVIIAAIDEKGQPRIITYGKTKPAAKDAEAMGRVIQRALGWPEASNPKPSAAYLKRASLRHTYYAARFDTPLEKQPGHKRSFRTAKEAILYFTKQHGSLLERITVDKQTGLEVVWDSKKDQ